MRRVLMSKVLRVMVILFTFHFSPLTSFAGAVLYDLDIRVVLRHDGSAMITETRQMTVEGSDISECYIGLANMDGAEVSNLSVSDETGRAYDFIGDWDTKRSRDEKAGQCGIVVKRDDIEICWGIGSEGEHTYVTRYELTGIVRGYEEADGIRQVFLDRAVWPKPEHARVTITREDGAPISPDNGVRAWAFGIRNGRVSFTDGALMVETTEAMTPKNALYVMARFDKGIFEPAIATGLNFEQKQKQAFENSDYYIDTWWDTVKRWWNTFCDWFWAILGGLICIGIPVYFVWGLIKDSFRKRKLKKRADWYRDIPVGGDLRRAARLIYDSGDTDKHGSLMSAQLMQLINIGALSVNWFDEQPRITVNDVAKSEGQPYALKNMHKALHLAAGDDGVLDLGELETFVKEPKNQEWAAALGNVGSMSTGAINLENPKYYKEAQQVLGLKKFLNDFTLLDERTAKEVTLWKDYLVWATLFGIAKQVADEMRRLNPDFFKSNPVASQMVANIDRSDMLEQALKARMQAYYERLAAEQRQKEEHEHDRSEGLGGTTSEGGGGGLR